MVLTQKRLKEMFNYERETGIFTRLITTSSRANAGDIAGSKITGGYLCIRIGVKLYSCHRLAWLYVTGKWPVDEIDHINGEPADNRWVNLRQASGAINSQNRYRARRDNQSGFLGASFRGNSFQAKIVVGGKRFYLGSFPTPDLAHAAYIKAKRRLHPGNML